MDSRCGRIDRHGFNVTSQEFGEPRFKLAAPVSGRQPPELKHGNSGFDLAVADRWLKKGIRTLNLFLARSLVRSSCRSRCAISVYRLESR